MIFDPDAIAPDSADPPNLGAVIRLDPEESAVALLDGIARQQVAIRKVERHLLELPQCHMATTHVVHGGMYARTIFIPAGTMLTGAEMLKDNICVVCGDITVTTHDGAKRLTGFHVIPANSGLKRAGLAHADTWWTSIWKTDRTEVKDIEDEATNEANMLGTRRNELTSEPCSMTAQQLQEG